jgi:endonuclease/exonuclease/phosphatase family metal-dependent hydrolase
MNNKSLHVNGKQVIKVMSYNINNGFYDRNLCHHPKRERAAVRTVRSYDPDILVVPEACFPPHPGQHGIKRDYQKIFGTDSYPFIGYSRRRKNNNWALAILSKYPMTTDDRANDHDSRVRAQIDLEGKLLIVDGIHPSPNRDRDGFTSNDKANWMRKVIDDSDELYIIAGDFNALSPDDIYHRDRLLRGFRRFQVPSDAEFTINDMLKAEEIRILKDRGLVDTYRTKQQHLDYTIPTKITNDSLDSAIRIDYIFCSPDIEVLDAGIIKTQDTNLASDHYPIFAELVT